MAISQLFMVKTYQKEAIPIDWHNRQQQDDSEI